MTSVRYSSPARTANWSTAPEYAAKNTAHDSSCGSPSRGPQSQCAHAAQKSNSPARQAAGPQQYSYTARQDESPAFANPKTDAPPPNPAAPHSPSPLQDYPTPA